MDSNGEQSRAGQERDEEEQSRAGETRAELGSAAADSEYNVQRTLDMGPWDWQTVYTALHWRSACTLSLSLFTANCTTNCFLASVSESNLRHCALPLNPSRQDDRERGGSRGGGGKQPAAAEASSRQRITSSYSYVAKSLARNFLKLCKQQIDGSLERAKERVEGNRRKGEGGGAVEALLASRNEII